MNTTSTDTSKPLPEPSDLAAPFWAALRAGELRLQHCDRCGHFNHPPRISCPKCHGHSFSWVPVAARGTVYSYTVVHRAPMSAFKADLPYAVALVDIEGTPVKLLSNLLAPLGAIHIGMPVDVVFEPASDEITLFKFVPSKNPGEAVHAQH
jgi:uncharacterized OB-fold protein